MWSAKACFRFVLWKLASTIEDKHARPLQIGETKVSPSKAVASYRTPHIIEQYFLKIHCLAVFAAEMLHHRISENPN